MVADLKPISKEFSDSVLDIEFWQKFAPNFTISQNKKESAIEIDKDKSLKHKIMLIKEGYTHVQQPGFDSPLEDIAQLFGKLVDAGIPAVFAFAYDELWQLNSQIRKIIQPLLDDTDYGVLPDFWAWHVSQGQGGWAPHRDKNASCLFADKTPKSLTTWIPITKAYPLNGCMYIIPASIDKGYGITGHDGKNVVPGATLPGVRALPGEPGDIFVWTQHAFHWGSQSAEEHDLPPRMSVAFEYQRLDVKAFNTPLMTNDTLPTFEERLALIAMQVQQYTHMYQFSPDLIALAAKIQRTYSLPKCITEKTEQTPAEKSMIA